MEKSLYEHLNSNYGYTEDDWWDDKEEDKRPTAKQLRKKYPALKDAYDQYKMLLKLCHHEEKNK